MALNSAEQPSPTFIDRFLMGLNTNRDLLVTPVQIFGMHIIPRYDALSGGLNMEITPQHTLKRRFGFTPGLALTGTFKNADIWPFSTGQYWCLDQGTQVSIIPAGGFTGAINLFTPSGGAGQTFFQHVGDSLYMANGVDAKKVTIANLTTRSWGIATPVLAPTITPAAGSLSPSVGFTYVYTYRDGSDGHAGSASPASASTGQGTSQQYTISGPGSTNPRVTFIDIFRTKDGGSTFFFNSSVANPGAGNFNFVDTTTDANLNTAIVAPINGINSPPPTGLTNITMHMGYIFGSVGNKLFVNAGAASTYGVPEECWPPSFNWTFPGIINGIRTSPWGLLVTTSSDIHCVFGINMQTFYPGIWLAGVGIQNPNAWDIDFNTLYLYTSSKQLLTVGTDFEEPGLKIKELSANFNPATAAITVHRYGLDKAVFISDSGNMLRYDLDLQGWSTLWNVTNCKMVKSIFTGIGVRQMLMGTSVGGGNLSFRDLTTNQDNGTPYTCFATIGGLILAAPMQVSQATAIGLSTSENPSSVSILLNEIDTGVPSYVPLLGVNDPAELPARQTLVVQRYDFNTANVFMPEQIQSIFVQIQFAATNTPSEILCLGIQ